MVADAAAGRTLVAVAGTHGKSTTSGWLVHTLVAAGADPAAFVGALLPTSVTGGAPATARWGLGPFVVEADEYAGNFDPYRPDLAVLTSVEWDHPDVFADTAAVSGAFETWIRSAAGGRTGAPTDAHRQRRRPQRGGALSSTGRHVAGQPDSHGGDRRFRAAARRLRPWTRR